ncbi:hypothetical protein E5288_WYG021606 [Bos mutus]|uniref:Uncharacterized protein n=1 Tax=Bos mutus TaxID=72004 RepID=A0A6B0RWN0_9CETA|nr:hypothetical protein [Bos mutus]
MPENCSFSSPHTAEPLSTARPPFLVCPGRQCAWEELLFTLLADNQTQQNASPSGQVSHDVPFSDNTQLLDKQNATVTLRAKHVDSVRLTTKFLQYRQHTMGKMIFE